MLEFISLGFKSDRFKTLMSSLGIIIGVLAIVVMLSVGEGLYTGVSDQFSTLDLDVIHVIPGSAHFGGPGGGPGSRNAAEPAKFTDKDTKVLENVPGVKNVAPRSLAGVVISFRNTNSSSSLTGVDPEKEQGPREEVVLGRWLSGSDHRSIVIGNGISQGMFRMKVTPGNKIRLYYKDRPMDFTVVGVLKEEKETGFGGGMGDSAGNILYITHKAMDELLGGESYYYDVFQVTVYNPNQLDSIIDRIMNDLRRHHRDEAYDAITPREILSTDEHPFHDQVRSGGDWGHIPAGGGNRHRQCDDAYCKGEGQGDRHSARPGGDGGGHSQAVSAGGWRPGDGLKHHRHYPGGRGLLCYRLIGRAALLHNPGVYDPGHSVRRSHHHHCWLLSGEQSSKA